MADKESSKPLRGLRGAPTTPEDYPTSAPPHAAYPSGDYSYTVELVSTIQHQLGKLTEAADALKEQVKEQGTELRKISQDVHAAKVVLSLVGGLILLAAGFFGWVISTYISTHPPK